MPSDCLFCRIVAKELPSHLVYENDAVVAILDIFPVSEGHTLVIPKAHGTDLRETSVEDAREMMRVVKNITPVILDVVGGDGFNLGMNNGLSASQEIPHTHLHIMPRKTGVPRSFEKTTGDAATLAALANAIRSRCENS